MATPITHIVLADKVYNNHFKNLSRKEFFIGTSFPDIRYLKFIERELTHFKGLSIKDLLGEDSFMAGLKFHSIVDEKLGDYFISNRIYEEFEEEFGYGRIFKVACKFFEDELFYDKLNDWEEITNYFRGIDYENIKFDIDKSDLDKWYSFLADYCKSKPTKETREKFIKALGFSPEEADEINKIIGRLKSGQELKSNLLNAYDKFDDLMK